MKKPDLRLDPVMFTEQPSLPQQVPGSDEDMQPIPVQVFCRSPSLEPKGDNKPRVDKVPGVTITPPRPPGPPRASPAGSPASLHEDSEQLPVDSPRVRHFTSLTSTGSAGSMRSVFSASDQKRREFDTWRISNYDELINNEFVSALHRQSVANIRDSLGESPRANPSGHLLTTAARAHVVDWDRQCNKEKLKDFCTLVRNLFWAFTEEDRALQETADATIESRPTATTVGSIADSCMQRVRKSADELVHHEVFSMFYFILTIYALFGPDTLLAMGYAAHNKEDMTLAIVNTIVFGLFVLEEVLQLWLIPGYNPRSGRFWVDTFATMSIVGDTWFGIWIGEIVESDAAVAGRGSRLVRLVRLGGRSSRLSRVFRVARVMQVVKLIPKIQEWVEHDTHQLAYLLWQKRLWHVFRHLDKLDTGRLNDEAVEFFDVGMCMEFGELHEMPGEHHLVSQVTIATIGRLSTVGHVVMNVAHAIAGDAERGYNCIAHHFWRTPMGRRTFQRCVDDVTSIKESCVLVERVISRLVLKCCVLVLVLLIMTQLFANSPEELVMTQGLHQLHLAGNVSSVSSKLCSTMVDEYYKVSPQASLLLLVLHHRVWWNATCRCCDDDLLQEGLYVQDPTAEGSVVESAVRATGLESHELMIEEISVDGVVSSLSVFDLHLQERSIAVMSILHTFLVVLILLAVVLLFGTDMKRLSNNNVLHPLWDLMDDMCALKSIEVLGSSAEGGHLPLDSYTTSQRIRPCRSCCRQQIPIAEELLQLRSAFDHLHRAMLAWSKFVPVTLLKQLFRAKVEARIGCSPKLVTTFFCDVHCFKVLCEDMSAREVLSLLDGVLGRIYRALDENGGTMLEFIGDEVLAIFNAPLQLGHHQCAAVTAAVEAQELVSMFPIPGFEDVAPRLACGVHTAQVLAGNLGAPTRMKYGVLGDGVNMCARLKSLNTRFETGLLVSDEALDFPQAHEVFLTRPVGKLILKGRTTPTLTHEVLCKRSSAPPHLWRGAEAHCAGFELFCKGAFKEALELLKEAHDQLSMDVEGDAPVPHDEGDRPSLHLIRLCEEYIANPPPPGWDGSEHLTKKAW